MTESSRVEEALKWADGYKGVGGMAIRVLADEVLSLREKKDDLFLSHQIAEVRRENGTLKARIIELQGMDTKDAQENAALRAKLAMKPCDHCQTTHPPENPSCCRQTESRVLELQEHHDVWRTRSQELAARLSALTAPFDEGEVEKAFAWYHHGEFSGAECGTMDFQQGVILARALRQTRAALVEAKEAHEKDRRDSDFCWGPKLDAMREALEWAKASISPMQGQTMGIVNKALLLWPAEKKGESR